MLECLSKIHFLIMDVDGTLTDGKIYMGQDGELFKAFDIKDGYGIKEILPTHDIIPVIITARESRIVANRCAELCIAELYQGCRNKYEKLLEILKFHSAQDHTDYDLSSVAYIGDDLLDLQCIVPVKSHGGYTACPADAVEEVKQVVDYVCTCKAGNGAVREFITRLVQ